MRAPQQRLGEALTAEDVPEGVLTSTSTVEAVCDGGATTLMALSDSTLKSVASMPPKVTELAPRKWLPVMTRAVPPTTLPDVLLSPLTLGAVAAL